MHGRPLVPWLALPALAALAGAQDPAPAEGARDLLVPGEERVADLVVERTAPCWRSVVGACSHAGALFVLEASGRLVRLAPDRLREERVVQLARRCEALTASAAGLVVRAGRELLVVDPETLGTLRVVEVPGGIRQVAAAVGSSTAFVLTQGPAGPDLMDIDLGAGAPGRLQGVARLTAELPGKVPGFRPDRDRAPIDEAFCLTPDARAVLVVSGERVHRLGVRPGPALVYEEGSPAVLSASLRSAPRVSPDGRRLTGPWGLGTWDPWALGARLGPQGAEAIDALGRGLAVVSRGELLVTDRQGFPLRACSLPALEVGWLVAPDAEGRALLLPAGPRPTPGLRLRLPASLRADGTLGPADAPAPAPERLSPPAPEGLVVDGIRVDPLAAGADPLGQHVVADPRGAGAVWARASDPRADHVSRHDVDTREGLALHVGRPVLGLTVSREGGVVLLEGGEAWVLDEALTVVRRVPASGLRALATSPGSSLAWGVVDAGQRDRIRVLDLAAGRPVRELTAASMVRGPVKGAPRPGWAPTFGQLWPSPDGGLLLATNEEGVARLRVEAGGDLVCEELAPGRGAYHSPFGAQGRRVALTGRGALGLFAADDLSEPLGRIDADVAALAVEPDGEGVFVAGRSPRSLLIYGSADGRKRSEHRFVPPGAHSDPDGLVALPGGRLVLSGRDGLWRLTLPAGGPARSSRPAAPPADGDLALAGTTRIDDLTVDQVTVAAVGTWVADALLDPDPPGALLVLAEDGLLRRVQADTLAERHRALGARARRVPRGAGGRLLARCAGGLLVVLQESEEVWRLDPTTLETREVLAVPGVTHVTGSPRRDPFLALAGGDDAALLRFDPRRGAPVRFTPRAVHDASPAAARPPGAPPLAGFAHATLSPEGDVVFCVDGGALNRLRLEEAALVLEETGPPVTNLGNAGIVVSSAGRRVGVLDGDERRQLRVYDAAQLSRVAARFAVLDPRGPLERFTAGAGVDDALELAAGPAGAPGAGGAPAGQLAIKDLAGGDERGVTLAPEAGAARRVLLVPGQRRAFVLLADRWVRVTWRVP